MSNDNNKPGRDREVAQRVAAAMLQERRAAGDTRTTFEQMQTRVADAFRAADNKRKG
jgi:hypothetical protein